MAWDFRNEDDVKQYLHNIGIEYRFGCYSEQRPDVCHLLGMYMENIKKNSEQAKKVWKVNCDTHKWSFSCHKYAYLLDKEKRPEDLGEIVDYYIRGCENGYNKACFMSGIRCGTKAEREADKEVRNEYYSKAIHYLDKACEEGIGQACFNLSSLYYSGIAEFLKPRNLSEVFKYTKKACEQSHMHACVNLSLMYLKGECTEKNPELAEKYKKKAKEIEKLWSTEGEGLKFEEGISNT